MEEFKNYGIHINPPLIFFLSIKKQKQNQNKNKINPPLSLHIFKPQVEHSKMEVWHPKW